MRLPLFLCILAISLLLTNITKAQTDSTHYDLGRLQTNKNFTQSITVKASDLERYQFNYITDALKIFFYGTFTDHSTVVYVIDGNIVNDVDAYSIQDIEEITLVQSALGQVSGAAPNQQLILIKTRRGGAGKQGITASNQTALVNARNNNNYVNATKPTGVYEQAYLGAYKNYSNGDVGISAGFLHDVSPQVLPAADKGTDPFHYNELRLNAYADARVWKGSTLSFGLNYTYEPGGYGNVVDDRSATLINEFVSRSRETQHLINTSIALRSYIASGLTNTLSAGYNHYNDFERATADQSIDQLQLGYSYNYHTLLTWQQHEHTLLFKDNLVYHQQMGDWNIDPSVNFMYRHVNDTLGESLVTYQDSVPNNNIIYGSSQKASHNLSLLTPSIDIYYKDIFNIQGGFTYIINKENTGTLKVQHLLPFVSTSVDFSQLTGIQSIKIKLFGSFSCQNIFLDDPYVSLESFALQGFDNPTGTFSASPNPIVPTAYNLYKAYNNYQAGFTAAPGKNFTFSYNFRENYSGTLVEYVVPVGANGAGLEDAYQYAKFTTHRIGLNYSFHSGNLNWTSGLIAATSKLQLLNAAANNQANSYLATGHRWTGGFTNRFAYHDYFAGIDILYQAGERPYNLEHWQTLDASYTAPSNKNSFSLQNLYIGTQLKINNWKYAEVYLNSRNILQNKSSNITDERRFYGAGVKVNF